MAASEPIDVVELEWLDGPARGTTIGVPRGDTLVGRAPSCGLVVDLPSISRAHAKLRHDGEHVTIEDLSSANGTFIGGERLDGVAVLQTGDVITLGTARRLRVEIRRNIETVAAPAAPPVVTAADETAMGHDWRTRMIRTAEGVPTVPAGPSDAGGPEPDDGTHLAVKSQAPAPFPPEPATAKNAASAPASEAHTVLFGGRSPAQFPEASESDDGGAMFAVHPEPPAPFPVDPAGESAVDAPETRLGTSPHRPASWPAWDASVAAPGSVERPSSAPPAAPPDWPDDGTNSVPLRGAVMPQGLARAPAAPLDSEAPTGLAIPVFGTPDPAPVTPREEPVVEVRLEGQDRTVTIPLGRSTVGRSATAPVSIPLPHVSRTHATLVVTPSAVTVEDAGSDNGTEINGRRVSGSSVLKEGDFVAFAGVAFRVRIVRTNGRN